MKIIINIAFLLFVYDGQSQYGTFIDSCNKKAKQYNKTDKKKLRQGLWIYFIMDPNPQVHEMNVSYGFYHNNIPIGVWQEKNKKGVMLSEQIYYDTLNGKLQFVDYYANGNPKSYGFHYSKQLNKPDTFYYINEAWKDHFEIITKKPLKGGNWIYFYENGKVESEGLYFEELKDGVWKYYNLEGVLIKEEEYAKGILKQ